VQVIHNSSDGLGVFGVFMTGLLRTTAADSLASGNGKGFHADSGAGAAAAVLTVANSKATNNGTGVLSETNSVMFLSASTLSGNSTGFDTTSGTIFSYGNNAYTDTSNSGILTSVSLR
jgi:hypothetical protein